MRVLDYLNNLGETGVETLIDHHPIKGKEYPSNVWILNYDGLDPKAKNDPLALECRQLIVRYDEFRNDCRGEWYVMSRSFDRFFNLYEKLDTFEFDYALEKLDGSIISLYFDDVTKQFQWATRSTAYAEATTNGFDGGQKFSDLCDKAWGFSPKENTEHQTLAMYWDIENLLSLTFELLGPANRVVTRYPKTELRLIGGRKQCGKELKYDELKKLAEDYLDCEMPVRHWHLKTLEDVITHVENLPSEQEGVVLVREQFKNLGRMKIKNKAYLDLAQKRNGGNITPVRIVKMIQRGDYDEYLTYFPEDAEFMDPWKEQYFAFAELTDQAYELCRGAKTQKDFASAVWDSTGHPPILFQLRSGKVPTALAGMNGIPAKKLAELLQDMMPITNAS